MPKTTSGKVTVPHISAVRGIESIVVGIYKLVGALMAADQHLLDPSKYIKYTIVSGKRETW